MNWTLDRKVWAIGFACIGMFVLGMSDNIRGPLFPELLTFFSLSNSEGSVSFAAASFAGLIGNISAGYLLRFYTLSRVLCISLFIMGMGLVSMGIAPSFAWFVLGSTLWGISIGLMGLTQNVLVAESAHGKEQSKALSGLHGIYGLSSLLAPLVASYSPQLLGSLGSWRSAFFVTAALAGVVALAASFVRANPSFEVHKPEAGVRNKRASKKALFFIGGLLAFYVVAEIMISSRLALYMRTYFAMDLEQSSLYVTGFFVMLLAGRILFAIRSFPYSYKTQINTSLWASIACLILGLKAHPLFFLLLGFAMALFYPICIAYISEQTGIYQRQFLAFAIGFQSFCVIAMHLGVGYLTDHFGLFYAFGVGIISLVLSLICVNFHPKIAH